MKITLVIPKWPKGSLWSNMVFRFPYLSITTLAALTPPEVEIIIQDENLQEICFEGFDLAAISIMTPLAVRGYEIADQFRSNGTKVIMGGFHATWLPDEAGRHADAVMVGEADTVWQTIIADALANRLKERYTPSENSDLCGLPPARRDLLRKDGYFFTNTIQTTRGCPFDCDFCSVTAFYGNTYRCRPLEDIEREIHAISGGSNFIFFVDDNITGNPGHAKKLFELLKKYNFRWLSQTSITFADNPELLKLAKESGCHGMFIGFETLTQEGLNSLNKKFNKADKYADSIKRIQDHGIGIQGSFIFGYDWDTKASFDAVVNFTEKTRLDSTLFTILTHYPGTRVFSRMMEEGRILTTDWSKYDMAHVVYKPKNMTVDELQQGYLEANRQFYSWGSMFKRLPAWRRSLLVFGPMNWGFRKAWQEFSY
ncbi:MAG: radical SAM protein [Nitrospirota bacterium]|nr:radical SAM protein [Nitrospirota bacterium]